MSEPVLSLSFIEAPFEGNICSFLSGGAAGCQDFIEDRLGRRHPLLPGKRLELSPDLAPFVLIRIGAGGTPEVLG